MAEGRGGFSPVYGLGGSVFDPRTGQLLVFLKNFVVRNYNETDFTRLKGPQKDSRMAKSISEFFVKSLLRQTRAERFYLSNFSPINSNVAEIKNGNFS